MYVRSFVECAGVVGVYVDECNLESLIARAGKVILLPVSVQQLARVPCPSTTDTNAACGGDHLEPTRTTSCFAIGGILEVFLD